MREDIIVFRLSGDLAHFKRPYTTTSPLTFDLPSPPTVLGIIGAILGIERDNYLSELNEVCQLSVSLADEPRKLNLGLNFLHTKFSFRGHHKTPHAIIETEFLVNPSFRVFCILKDKSLQTHLATKLQNRTPHYIPFLGIAWCLADFTWLGTFPAERVHTNKEVDITGWLPQTSISIPKLQEGKRYHMTTLPIKMTPDRQVVKFADMIYEYSGKTIRCTLKEDETAWCVHHNGQLTEGEKSYVYLV